MVDKIISILHECAPFISLLCQALDEGVLRWIEKGELIPIDPLVLVRQYTLCESLDNASH